MATVFAQKRELGLVKSLARNSNAVGVVDVDPEIDFMLLLAGHDPASRKLRRELNSVATDLPINACTANFMGFGLYKENVFGLAELQTRFAQQP